MDEVYDDRALRRELGELSDRLDDLPDQWQLDQKHRELSDSIDEVRREHDDKIEELETDLRHDLERRHDELRTEHEQARTTLERRLRWIERHIRATAGAATTQLDPTLELTSLAQLADRGKTLRAQLLDPSTRSARKMSVAAWETWQNTYQARAVDAVTASRTIAGTTPEHPDRPEAVEAFRAAPPRSMD